MKTANDELVYELRRIISDRHAPLSSQRRDALEARIDEYLTACKLAVGPDLKRSKHWRKKGLILQGALRETLHGLLKTR